MPTLAVVAGRLKLKLRPRLPFRTALADAKLPVPSRFIRVLVEFALVAVLPRITLPAVGEAVMSALPVTESTPVLVKVNVAPRVPDPPILKPLPAVTIMELLASWPLFTVPLNCAVGSVPDRLLAVLAKMA